MSIKRLLIIVAFCDLFLSCTEKDNTPYNYPPKFDNVSFEVQDNRDKLLEDIKCVIIGDSLVECWIPYLLDNKGLKPTITFNAELCTIDSLPYRRGETIIDFRRPIKLSLTSNGTKKDYLMLVHTFTGLPIVRIDTKNNVEIVSKEEYVEANISIEEDILHGHCSLRNHIV